MAQDKTDNVGILKSIWKKNEAGIWSVHNIQGIYLKPRDGFGKDYFKIKNEMNLLTQRPGNTFENIFASFGTTEFLLRQSIVPIVAWNDGDQEMRCIGTGLFISASGLLMTAAHVLRDPIDEEYTTLTQVGDRSFKLPESLRMGALLPVNPAMRNAPAVLGGHPSIRGAKWLMAPIEWAHHWGKEIESPLFHEKAEYKLDLDIAVCKVREHPLLGPYQPLNIGQQNLRIGDRAVAIGYAEMKNIPFKPDADCEPELIVSVGSVTNIYPDNITEKQSPTPGPNFEFDAKIPGRMSGGPILVGSGILTKGIVSRSWQDENHASGCLIGPIMGWPLEIGKSLLDLMNDGNEGMAKVQGPGL